MKSNITFDRFNEALTEIVRYIEFDDAICAACRKYSEGSEFVTEFPYPLRLMTTVVDLLELATNDTENGWISYWLYELDCGKDYKEGCVTKDGENIPLKTSQDLWNLLVSEQEALS